MGWTLLHFNERNSALHNGSFFSDDTTDTLSTTRFSMLTAFDEANTAIASLQHIPQQAYFMIPGASV
jgi:hypothetical protein